MHDDAQRIDRLSIHQNRHFHEISLAVAIHFILETRIATGAGLEAIVKIEHHFVEWQFIFHQRSGANISEVCLLAAFFGAECQHIAQMLIGYENSGVNPWFVHGFNFGNIGVISRVMQLDLAAIGHVQLIDYRWRRGDEIEIKLTLEPFLNNFEMQQPKEAAAKAEAKRIRAFGLETETCIVKAQLRKRILEVFKIRRFGGVQAAEHHRLHRLKPRQGRIGEVFLVGDRITHIAFIDHFYAGLNIAYFTWPQLAHRHFFGGEGADRFNRMGTARIHHTYLLSLANRSLKYADEDDNAEIGIVPAIHKQGFQCRFGVALGRWHLVNNGFQQIGNAKARFGGYMQCIGAINPDHIFDLLRDPLWLGGRKVDFVQHRHDLVIVIERLVHIRQRLRFHTLARIHHQQRAFACGQTTAHLIGEIDVAGRIH